MVLDNETEISDLILLKNETKGDEGLSVTLFIVRES